MPVDQNLNPAQRATLGVLGAGDTDARVDFGPDLADELRARLDHDLAEVAAHHEPDRPLVVTKYLLNGVHGCQARFLHERDRPFEPSIPIVRGSIAHKAIELAVHWPGPPLPLDLVDEALARVRNADHWAADFLVGLAPGDLAELRGAVVELVNAFLESWPPLQPAMRPATEARLWAEVADRRISLRGQADLTLGQPIGSGSRARKIIVDYKTGGRSPEHRSDLRFYALVETLKLGVPPRLLVTAYLTTATLESEPVTAELLHATVARVVDGVRGLHELTTGSAEAIRRPSVACRWCELLADCAVGTSFLEDDR